MPLQDDMHLISVDDHLIEHSRVWLDRMPEKYQDDCPRVIESGAEGMYSEFGSYVPPHSQAWLYEGNIHAQMGLNAVAGKPPEALGLDPVRYGDWEIGGRAGAGIGSRTVTGTDRTQEQAAWC